MRIVSFLTLSNIKILFVHLSYVLTQILSSDNQDREHVVENIHNYLRTVGEETRKGLIPMDKFVVNKVTNHLSLLDNSVRSIFICLTRFLPIT